MKKMLKIFCYGVEQDELAEKNSIVERYQGFLLAEVDEQAVDELILIYPVEDISDQYQLKLGDQVIDTSQVRLNVDGALLDHPYYKSEKKLSSGFHHHLVQFIGPIKEKWLKNIKKLGAEPRTPLTAFTYVVRSNDNSLSKLMALPFIRWVGHLPHKDRIEMSLLSKAGRKVDDIFADLPRTRVMPGSYIVEFFATKELTNSLAKIKKLGFQILTKDPLAKVIVISDPKNGAGTVKRIQSLSTIHGVRFIRERIIKRTSNDVAANIMGTANSMASDNLDLSGEGEIIGVCDTGIDNAEPKNIHADFSGRVAGIKSFPITADYSSYINNPKGNDGAADLDSGHGTHVAGSVLGDGSVSANLPNGNAIIRGLSHQAKLYFQAVEQEMKWKNPSYNEEMGRYILSGLPNDLTDLFKDAYKNKVRIHSNSWGGGDPGAYDAQSEQVDQFIWKNKDFCVLFANGNDGSDADGDGKINPMSVTSPATSKNCISVGASENFRPQFNFKTYGGMWPDDYPAAPINADPTANNAEQVVAFSSRGPTKDGRIKPDVVAPGTFILSTRSTMLALNNSGWSSFPPSKKYFYMGGTSMATPLTAGAVGLIREYLRKEKNFKSPTAALLKASLIHGAVKLPQINETEFADNDQGFGRVNVDAIVTPDDNANIEFSEIKPGLRTGEIHSINISVKSDRVPLKVTMTYSDYPGPTLINNLNLMLQAPDGTRYVGNPSSGNGLTLDIVNNVELINISNPTPGVWVLSIVASNIPQGPQDFALVYSADIGEIIAQENVIRVSESPMQSIPDANSSGIKSSLTINDIGNISHMSISVDIEHSYIGDLIVTLTSPNQNQIVLHNRTGASKNDLIEVYDIQNTLALARFKDMPINGEWTLSVSDLARVDNGKLRQWGIEATLQNMTMIEKSSEPFVNIPDNDQLGIIDVINVVETGLVKKIEVSIDVTHTWVADLVITLSAPNGRNVNLHKKSGGSRDNIIKTYLSENLPNLTNFEGLEMSGDWVLKVVDGVGKDVGKLNQWGIKISV